MDKPVCANQFCAHWQSAGCSSTTIAIDYLGRCIDYLPIQLSQEQLATARRQTHKQVAQRLKCLQPPKP